MEINKCNICGGEQKIIYELPFLDLQGFNERKYVQKICLCEKCGFIYTKNPFSEEQLADRYKNFSKFEFDSKEYILDEADEYKKRCVRQYDFIKGAIGEDFLSMLEIGAASGYNLSLYTDKEVKGIEPSWNNCYLASKYYKLDMYNGMFDQYIREKDSKKYDMIFISNTLEHIVNPMDFILKCKSICNKYMFIEVPSFDYKFIEEPLGMFCEEHVNYFTLEGLTNLMKSVGFELIDVNIVFGLGNYLPAAWPALSTVWKITEDNKRQVNTPVMDTGLIINTYIDKNKRALEGVKNMIDKIPSDEKLAVWGTGHHASMLLANTSLGEKNIVKVYDSDKRKHHYTFAEKNICSFDEQDIYNKEIDSILIATYTAQKAICKITDKYKELCKIYTLYDLI